MLKMTLKTLSIACLLVGAGVAVAALATRKPPAEPPMPRYGKRLDSYTASIKKLSLLGSPSTRVSTKPSSARIENGTDNWPSVRASCATRASWRSLGAPWRMSSQPSGTLATCACSMMASLNSCNTTPCQPCGVSWYSASPAVLVSTTAARGKRSRTLRATASILALGLT